MTFSGSTGITWITGLSIVYSILVNSFNLVGMDLKFSSLFIFTHYVKRILHIYFLHEKYSNQDKGFVFLFNLIELIYFTSQAKDNLLVI